MIVLTLGLKILTPTLGKSSFVSKIFLNCSFVIALSARTLVSASDPHCVPIALPGYVNAIPLPELHNQV